MKILATSDWRSTDPAPVVEIALLERPDLILHGGNFQGETITSQELDTMQNGIAALRRLAPFLGVAGKLDKSPKVQKLDFYIKDFDMVVSGDATILCLSSIIAADAMDMLIPMFLERITTPVKAILAHGVPCVRFAITGDSTGESFLNSWGKEWDLVVLGGIPVAQNIGNILVPGGIEKTTNERFLSFSSDKGVWIWENGETRFVKFACTKSAKDAMEELYA